MQAQVDQKNGIIIGATVAEANVPAKGHFVFVDETGSIVKEGTERSRKLPLMTDAKTLETALARAHADKQARVRTDHSDAIQDRAGFADTFRISDGKLVCNVHLFDAFKDRDAVLEAADKTPGLIGLSLDFQYSVEVAGDRAYARAVKIHAVDIVDEGAVTPRGLFSAIRLSAAGSDQTTNTSTTMDKETNAASAPAEKQPAASDIAALIATLASMCDRFEKHFTKMEAATIAKEPAGKEEVVPAEKPHTEPDGDEEIEELKASVKKLSAAQSEMRKEFSALGVKPSDAPKASSDSAALPVVADTQKPATTATAQFFAKVEELKSKGLKATQAAHQAAVDNREIYAASLKERGIAK
jgi:hypothetical protein